MPNGEDKWTWSDERAFIENLLNTRFGSLLILFELVVLGAVMCDEQSHLQIVLWLGVLILALCPSQYSARSGNSTGF